MMHSPSQKESVARRALSAAAPTPTATKILSFLEHMVTTLESASLLVGTAAHLAIAVDTSATGLVDATVTTMFSELDSNDTEFLGQAMRVIASRENIIAAIQENPMLLLAPFSTEEHQIATSAVLTKLARIIHNISGPVIIANKENLSITLLLVQQLGLQTGLLGYADPMIQIDFTEEYIVKNAEYLSTTVLPQYAGRIINVINAGISTYNRSLTTFESGIKLRDDVEAGTVTAQTQNISASLLALETQGSEAIVASMGVLRALGQLGPHNMPSDAQNFLAGLQELTTDQNIQQMQGALCAATRSLSIGLDLYATLVDDPKSKLVFSGSTNLHGQSSSSSGSAARMNFFIPVQEKNDGSKTSISGSEMRKPGSSGMKKPGAKR